MHNSNTNALKFGNRSIYHQNVCIKFFTVRRNSVGYKAIVYGIFKVMFGVCSA